MIPSYLLIALSMTSRHDMTIHAGRHMATAGAMPPPDGIYGVRLAYAFAAEMRMRLRERRVP